ncbi:MAG TPA: nitrite/sulfite reductase [Terriglobia bacterium]|nr:nitrite/sulfite reductase [Terriglobia bacterium]
MAVRWKVEMPTTWKDKLAPTIDPQLAAEIDAFETEIALRKQGKMDEKVFAETRLRRGCYGQRYDNGQRHDGVQTQKLRYPTDTTKGPDTLWDAPGMQRIKIPFGGVTPDQMDALADTAEEYADGILHVTTRQDFQLHYVHIDDTPELMRRLAAVGITTREACGNSIRNVTACPLAGVCRTETFDVAPYAKATARFMLGHPDAQNFGRKFKIAFSGCAHEACGLVNMHDLGAVAVTRVENGVERRGFELYVGGGLGAVPHEAKLFDAFLPAEELLPITQAISRVFARLGEKRNRAQARVKFLIAKLGIDEFRRLVLEERKTLSVDPRWKTYLDHTNEPVDTPLRPPSALNGAARPEGFDAWHATNVYRQKQEGYAVAAVTLPLGDLTAWQMRELAQIARRFSGDSVRTTVEQNMVLRWVSEADLPKLYSELQRIGLGDPGAGTIVDVTACPGTDTCKLGISSSRGLAAELRSRLAAQAFATDEAVRNLRIKISGCFNSCGQHHIADLGFYGVTRAIGNRKVPHFQVVLGGQWQENGGAYGLALGAPVPSKRIPETVERIAGRYIRERQGDESFQAFIKRLGKKELRAMIEDLTTVPAYERDASFYSDWGDPREYTIGDMGIGECAGEVVSVSEFAMAAAERLVFEGQLKLEDGDHREADGLAYRAMLEAARSLVLTQMLDVADDATVIVQEFRARFHDSPFFPDRYAGNRFAEYLFRRHSSPPAELTGDHARRIVEEAQLFIEAAYAGHHIIAERGAGPTL